MIGKIILLAAAAHAINVGPEGLLMLLPAKGAVGHIVASAIPKPSDLGQMIKDSTRRGATKQSAALAIADIPPLPPLEADPPHTHKIRIHF